MIKHGYFVVIRGIRNLSIALILFTFSNHVVLAEDIPDNNESKRLYESSCTQCHGLQPIEKTRDGRSGWEKTVHKMVVAGAQLNADEMELVIDYLFQHFGMGVGGPMRTGTLPPDSPLQTNGVTSESIVLPEDEGETLVRGYCHLCHDLGRVVSTRRSADAWKRYTKNMLSRGDITVPAEDIEIIVSYLNRYFGKND
jgi:cytochrome c5